MRGTMIHAPDDVRFETLDDPKILRPTDPIIRTAVTCACSSDLWPYRGSEEIGEAHPMGHDYVAVVEEVGSEVSTTDIVTERGDESIARTKELTDGISADTVLECVGTAQSMQQALRSARPGGNVGFVGVPHDVAIGGEELFFSLGLRGGPAPVRRYLPDLIDRVLSGKLDPGKVFDLTLPLDQIAEGYKSMDKRRAIKTLLKP
ncbi:zinc-binding dehydrogenase [Amycolatopsis sp. NPDC051371]|uniref:zinc-binding dehydrogenase n=1 Tax=Amycolatopsis sp. NPDC051371 TaxID=3155800 RepID=UPI003440CB5B